MLWNAMYNYMSLLESMCPNYSQVIPMSAQKGDIDG